MNILVTGGAGFIGSNFVRYLSKVRPDWKITVFDSLSYAGDEKNLVGLNARYCSFIKGDICDEQAIDKAISRADAVVHFAAETHVDNSLHQPLAFVNTNIVGTFRVIEAVRKHGKRLHHVSTDEVYGELKADESKINEVSAYNPSSPYSATKAASDHLVRAWYRSFGLKVTISNCSNNYGPYQHVEKFIPRQITNILLGDKPLLYGNGQNIRDWIYSEDHSSAVLTILEKGKIGETYMIGANGEKTNQQVLQMILQLMGKSPDYFEQVADRPGHDLRYGIDATKLQQQLGWQPKYTDFKEGLASTIEWYKNNQSWWRSQKAKAEAKYAEMGQ